MNNRKKIVNRTQRKSRVIKVVIIILVILIPAIWIGIRELNRSSYEYLKEVFVGEAKVVEKNTVEDSESRKYWIRLELINQNTNITLAEEQSWFEVNAAFYDKCETNTNIGVLVGNFDIFKEALFGSYKEVFENSAYAVVDVFHSLDEANEAYPHKTFTASAELKRKTTSVKDGNYFVLNYDEREMSIQVDDETYNKYQESDTIPCNFDGIGDFIKVTGIK